MLAGQSSVHSCGVMLAVAVAVLSAGYNSDVPLETVAVLATDEPFGVPGLMR